MKKKFWKLYLLALVAFCSCTDPYEGSTYQVYSVNPVSAYLETRSDEFSEWIKVLKYADLFNAVNQATESFTVFAPDNDALYDFYEKKRVSSVEELGKEYARSLAQYHILNDSVSLEEFILGGKLEAKTLSDDYLTVTFDEDSEAVGGFNSVYLNKEAYVKELAIRVSNGYVYRLNAVLSPLVESVYDRITDQSELFSIFKEACDKTGWKDSLNTIYDEILQSNGSTRLQKRNYTLLAVSDEVFKESGILSFNDLVDSLYVEDDNYTDPENELFRYMAYHIIPGSYSTFELKLFDSGKSKIWGTSDAEAVIAISLENDDKYYINYGGEEIKAMFIEEKSDVLARNGTIHQLDGYLPIWESEVPSTVYFDFCNNPVIASYIASNGTAGQVYQTIHASSEYRTEITNLSCFTVIKSPSGVGGTGSWNYVDYFTVKTGNNFKTALYSDMLIVNIGNNGSISMKTPVLIKGKYKVTLVFGYSTSMNFIRISGSGSNGGLVKFIFDEDETKSVQRTPYTSVPASTLGMYSYVLFNELEFNKTKAHDLKIVVMDPTASTNASFRLQLDYLLFEPIIEE